MNGVERARRAVSRERRHRVHYQRADRRFEFGESLPTLTCGTYDAAGDFVCRIRLLAKNSVSGGIVAMPSGEMAVYA